MKSRDISIEDVLCRPLRPADRAFFRRVEEKLVLELKTVDHLLPVHEAQVLTYLKLTGLDVGLLVNFNTSVLRRGIRRLVRRSAEAVRSSRFRIEDDLPGTTSRPASTPPEAVGAEPDGSND
jgi:hypothetical protein